MNLTHNETLRRDADLNDLARFAYKGAGVMLVMKGIRGRGLIGAAMTVGGLAMLFPERFSRMVESVWPAPGHQAQGTPQDAPSFRDDDLEMQQRPQDEVDAAAMASFPASDPPSSYHSS